MKVQTPVARRLMVAALALSLFSVLIALSPVAQPQRGIDSTSSAPPGRDDKHSLDGGWSEEERLRELMLWHELNRRETARFHPLGEEGVGADVIVTDINDVSVIQDQLQSSARTQPCGRLV